MKSPEELNAQKMRPFSKDVECNLKPVDENGKITDAYLARLEDEAIDGVAISPDDALLVFDRIHELEAERDALLKEVAGGQ